MQGPTSPVPIPDRGASRRPGVAKRTAHVTSPKAYSVPSEHLALKNGELGYQLDLSQEHVMQELNARHNATTSVASNSTKSLLHVHQQALQQHQPSPKQPSPQRQGTSGRQRMSEKRSLSPTSDFWRQQQTATERTASQGLQEVIVYSGHYNSPLPPVPGGTAEAGTSPRQEKRQHRLTQPIVQQSVRGSLSSGLAGLAVSGGRSEFPVVPVEATLVKAVLVWSAGGAASVEIKGSFDDWGCSRRLAQQPDGSWSISAYLLPGVYQYKYVVDGVWRYDPWAPVVRDEDGNLNNIIEVIDPCTSYDIPNDFDAPPSPVSSYAQQMPAASEMPSEPPVLPPQAHLTPLDLGLPAGAAAWLEAGDARPLHPAQHAIINHIFVEGSLRRSASAAAGEVLQPPKGPLVIGASVRFRGKHVVTVMYKPRPSAGGSSMGLTESGSLPSGAMPDFNV